MGEREKGKNVQPVKRWIPRAIFHDDTDSHVLSCYNTEFSALCGKTVQEVEESGVDVEEFMQSTLFQRKFKLLVKTTAEEYQGEFKARFLFH